MASGGLEYGVPTMQGFSFNSATEHSALPVSPQALSRHSRMPVHVKLSAICNNAHAGWRGARGLLRHAGSRRRLHRRRGPHHVGGQRRRIRQVAHVDQQLHRGGGGTGGRVGTTDANRGTRRPRGCCHGK